MALCASHWKSIIFISTFHLHSSHFTCITLLIHFNSPYNIYRPHRISKLGTRNFDNVYVKETCVGCLFNYKYPCIVQMVAPLSPQLHSTMAIHAFNLHYYKTCPQTTKPPYIPSIFQGEWGSPL